MEMIGNMPIPSIYILNNYIHKMKKFVGKLWRKIEEVQMKRAEHRLHALGYKIK